MCSGPRKPSPPPPATAAKDHSPPASILLELAAADDLAAFRCAVEQDGLLISSSAPWYGPSAAGCGGGGARLATELRTPLMIATLYGSAAVATYILAVSPSASTDASPSDAATPLHLAAAGGSASALGVSQLLLAAGASADSMSSSGLRPGDLIPRSVADKHLRLLLKSTTTAATSPSSSPKKQEPKKEYPQDLTLPDLKTGIFSTDEFRMYSFKVKPCSRAYTHDWTECPFVHPGENARRRDPRRYSYSCVPCPEFRKAGACRKGDACEYAHGVFECWLHPAQYRTRLCKDEVGCARRICFFAHKPEELRAVNPSAVSVGLPPVSSPPSSSLLMMSPSGASSPVPAQSRLKTALGGAREMDFDLELLSALSSPRANWTAAARTAPDYSELLGSVDPALLSQLHALSRKQTGDLPSFGSLNSVPDTQMHASQLLAGFDSSRPSSSMVSANTAFGLDHSMAKAIMSSRASAFAKRSQSFCDRGRAPVSRSLMSPAPATSVLSDWGSPDGKLDWGVQGDELHKLRKSASFGFRSAQTAMPVTAPMASTAEPDVSWVNSLVKEWPEKEQMVA